MVLGGRHPDPLFRSRGTVVTEHHQPIIGQGEDIAVDRPTLIICQFAGVDRSPGLSLIFGSPTEYGVGLVAAKAHGQIDDGAVAGHAEGRVPTVGVLSCGIELMDDLWWCQGGSTIPGDRDRWAAATSLAMKARRDIGCDDCALGGLREPWPGEMRKARIRGGLDG